MHGTKNIKVINDVRCSQINIKHINKLCGQKVEFLNVKAGGTYSDQWALEG